MGSRLALLASEDQVPGMEVLRQADSHMTLQSGGQEIAAATSFKVDVVKLQRWTQDPASLSTAAADETTLSVAHMEPGAQQQLVQAPTIKTCNS